MVRIWPDKPGPAAASRTDDVELNAQHRASNTGTARQACQWWTLGLYGKRRVAYLGGASTSIPRLSTKCAGQSREVNARPSVVRAGWFWLAAGDQISLRVGFILGDTHVNADHLQCSHPAHARQCGRVCALGSGCWYAILYGFLARMRRLIITPAGARSKRVRRQQYPTPVGFPRPGFYCLFQWFVTDEFQLNKFNLTMRIWTMYAASHTQRFVLYRNWRDFPALSAAPAKHLKSNDNPEYE